jgi:lambda family phage portal protein
MKPPVSLNLLDRAIALFSPEAAVSRARARLQLSLMAERGGYEGARTDWRGSSWRMEPAGANTTLYGDLPTLRNRARSLVRNNPLAKRSIEILVSHTVGCGLIPSFQTDSTAQRRRLKSAWDRYVDTADARGQTTLYGLQEQAVRGMFESGEILAIKEIDRANQALNWLIVEGDLLDHGREGVFAPNGAPGSQDSDGYVTRLGVAFVKESHKRAGYWLFPQHPGDAILWGQYPISRFVPAEGVEHLYRVRRPGAVRGVTELAAALVVMRDYADYWESALVKARVEAALAGFVTSEASGTGSLSQRQEIRPAADGTSSKAVFGEMVPGTITRLTPGEDIKFSQPASNPNFENFSIHAKQDAAVGIGVTYDQATGDLRQANYSSLRAGKIEFRQLIEMIRDLTIIPMLCRPMMRDFRTFYRTFGDLTDRDVKVPVRWIAPAWQPIDPLKDLQADINAVRSGRLSQFDFIASWGTDPHEQIEEIARANAELDEKKIVLDTDPRRVSSAGQMQSAGLPGEPDSAKD